MPTGSASRNTPVVERHAAPDQDRQLEALVLLLKKAAGVSEAAGVSGGEGSVRNTEEVDRVNRIV